MKRRDIVLHVCFNHVHREALINNFIKSKNKLGLPILKHSKRMVIVGEEEHIFRLVDDIAAHGLDGMIISHVEGFVPMHLQGYVNALKGRGK